MNTQAISREQSAAIVMELAARKLTRARYENAPRVYRAGIEAFAHEAADALRNGLYPVKGESYAAQTVSAETQPQQAAVEALSQGAPAVGDSQQAVNLPEARLMCAPKFPVRKPVRGLIYAALLSIPFLVVIGYAAVHAFHKFVR